MLLLLATACRRNTDNPTPATASVTDVPPGFPEIPFEKDNPYTKEKWLLGKKLFFEKAFSTDNSISCASCHRPSLAFSDNVARSIGAGGITGRRNAPTLANVAYHPYYTRDGSVPTLEMQILVPIQEHDEFNSNILEIAERLKQIPEYVTMSQAAYGREPDAYVITRALGIFERTLISGSSLYDAYIGGDAGMLSASAQRGLALFFSERTQCSSCHSGFNFTNYAFTNNGLYMTYADSGRQRFTGDTADRAHFKVPSLRNVALTAPYMHDGSIATLQQVITHYNSGGQPHPGKSPLIKPLNLTETEQADLLAFLSSLTDEHFIANSSFAEDK